MNNFPEANQLEQVIEHQFVVDTPSLTGIGNEVVPEELVRDLLRLHWIRLPQWLPLPSIDIPTDVQRVAQSTGTADVLSITSGGEQENYHGHRLELVDITVTIDIRISVPQRGGRQRMHNLKAATRATLYRYAKVLTPFLYVYYDGFSPDYEATNLHAGTMHYRLRADAVPLFSRHVAGQLLPASDPDAFPRGLLA